MIAADIPTSALDDPETAFRFLAQQLVATFGDFDLDTPAGRAGSAAMIAATFAAFDLANLFRADKLAGRPAGSATSTALDTLSYRFDAHAEDGGLRAPAYQRAAEITRELAAIAAAGR